MRKLMHWCVIASALSILVAPPMFAAGSPVDGIYNGMTKVTFGSAPVCGSD